MWNFNQIIQLIMEKVVFNLNAQPVNWNEGHAKYQIGLKVSWYELQLAIFFHKNSGWLY